MTGTDGFLKHSIITFFKDHLNVDVLSPDHDLIEAGILDSLMIVDLVLYFEQTFDMSLSLEDLEIENFATVASMAALVAGRGSRSGAGDSGDQPRRLSVA
jgi:acyl carrier protein